MFTTVVADEAITTVRSLGADMAWNRRSTDLLAAVKETGGADVILDVVGGPTLSNVGMLREHGRLVIIGTLGGASGELPIGRLMGKRGRVIGTTLRSRGTEAKRQILEATEALAWPLLVSGALQIPIHDRFPLEQAAEAQAVLREGGRVGQGDPGGRRARTIALISPAAAPARVRCRPRRSSR